jgi:hypothetical protein
MFFIFTSPLPYLLLAGLYMSGYAFMNIRQQREDAAPRQQKAESFFTETSDDKSSCFVFSEIYPDNEASEPTQIPVRNPSPLKIPCHYSPPALAGDYFCLSHSIRPPPTGIIL